MALEAYCASCTYLGENADYNGKYWCDRKGEARYACDARCYNWCEAYRRSDSSRKNMYENSSSHMGGGCYLTTAMCNILGFEDNNYYLHTLRMFRDTVLKKNRKYWGLLITYDTIGPMIAYNLMNDENKEEIATTLFNNYIEKTVSAIEECKNETAINIYTAMTNSLAERYNINSQIITINPDEVDVNSLGHARKRVPSV